MIKHRYQAKLKEGKKPNGIKKVKREKKETILEDKYQYCWA